MDQLTAADRDAGAWECGCGLIHTPAVTHCPRCHPRRQHDFPDPGGFRGCTGCGLYVEECMEVPFCSGVKVDRQAMRRGASREDEGE